MSYPLLENAESDREEEPEGEHRGHRSGHICHNTYKPASRSDAAIIENSHDDPSVPGPRRWVPIVDFIVAGRRLAVTLQLDPRCARRRLRRPEDGPP
ncbi:hypothetical protein LPU83_2522 [Rhizobium favelukesii]|uniref:Uncharacterized protein n=1 Tax=Rhizobium favelukesii TaxID=348824 RepID=W6RV54_9HYPH|nr:hypothetical protein LPU83_2522 [Rhizobium favelukesii]